MVEVEVEREPGDGLSAEERLFETRRSVSPSTGKNLVVRWWAVFLIPLGCLPYFAALAAIWGALWLAMKGVMVLLG